MISHCFILDTAQRRLDQPQRIINGFDLLGILKYLHENGYHATVDLTAKRGCLWAITLRPEQQDSRFFADLRQRFGACFIYKIDGGKKANGRGGPAWWFNPMNEQGSRWA